MLKYLFLIFLLLLTSCASKYDVQLSEISFDHDGNLDVISYEANNPTDYDLICELKINLEGAKDVTDSFEIASGETKIFSSRAKFPTGETNVIMKTRCKPSN